MCHSTTPTTQTSTPRASLATPGLNLRHLNLFGPIRDQVRIRQKTVRHTPADKLYDALITILAGAHGLVDVNTRLRSDPAFQAAFGRSACAEHSVTEWVADPQVSGREVGWVPVPGDKYARPVVRVAVRCRRKNGQWATGVLIATLDPAAVLGLAGMAADATVPGPTVLLAYARDS